MANENGQKNLIIEEDAGLITLTMNRPEKRNALSTAMMTELNEAMVAIGKRIDARAVIFYASLSFFFLFLTLRVVESRRWK